MFPQQLCPKALSTEWKSPCKRAQSSASRRLPQHSYKRLVLKQALDIALLDFIRVLAYTSALAVGTASTPSCPRLGTHLPFSLKKVNPTI